MLRAVVDRLVGEQSLDVFADRTVPWRRRIQEVALGLRARLLDVLAEAGLSEEDAARASCTLIVYLLGSIALEAAELDPAKPVPPEEERVAERRKGFEAVPAQAFPRTAASADVMAAYISTDQFLWGLERLVDGLVRD